MDHRWRAADTVGPRLDRASRLAQALRHTYATALLAEGFSIVEVQRLMRHSDIRTTSVYLEVRDEQLAAKVRAVSESASVPA